MSTGERLAAEQRYRVESVWAGNEWHNMIVTGGDLETAKFLGLSAAAARLNALESLTAALVEALLVGCREKCDRDSRGWWHSAMCPLTHDQRELIARYEESISDT